jgi:hypothetical protein
MLTSPLRASILQSLDQLDPVVAWKKLRGKDQDLQTPPPSRPLSSTTGDHVKSRSAWAGSTRYAAQQARQETNRLVRDLKSRHWQDRQRACEHLGERLSRQNYPGLARLADLICSEKDCNVLDAALEAMLKINGHFHARGLNDAHDRGGASPPAPAQSSAGLPTPMTESSSPMYSPAKILSPAISRPNTAQLSSRPSQEAEMSAGNRMNLVNLPQAARGIGARPLDQLRGFSSNGQGQRLGRGPGAAAGQGAEGGGGRVRRPASAAGAIECGFDGGDPQESKETYCSVTRDLSAMSPLLSPLMHELSRRRHFSQRTVRGVGWGNIPLDGLASPLSRNITNDVGRESQLKSQALAAQQLCDGSPLRGVLRPRSAPASRLKHLLKKSSSIYTVAKTIGADRTEYDQGSYNRCCKCVANVLLMCTIGAERTESVLSLSLGAQTPYNRVATH